MNGGIFDLSSRCFDPVMNNYCIADDSNLASTCYRKITKKITISYDRHYIVLSSCNYPYNYQ